MERATVLAPREVRGGYRAQPGTWARLGVQPCGRGEFLAVTAISVAAIAARLLRLHCTTGGHWARLTFSDEASYYLSAARLLREQGWAFFSTDRSLWNGPLVPLWVLLFSMRVAAVKVANVLLVTAAGLLAWNAARARAGRVAGMIALLLCAAHPPFAVFGPTILTEPPFVFLVTLAFWIAARSEGRRGWLFAAGLVVGLAALARPTIQLWPLFAVALSWVAGIAIPALATHRRASAALFAGFALVVVPVAARNAAVLGRPAIANGFGAVLYLGNDLRRDGDEPSYSGFDFDTAEWTAPFAHLDSEGDRRLMRRAIQYIRAHPADMAVLTLRKAVRYLVGEPASYLNPHRDILSAARAHRSGWGWALLEMLTTVSAVMLGLAAMSRWRRDLNAFLAISFVVYMTALHALAFPIPRLALPMFPLLALHAGCTVSELCGSRAGIREKLAAGLVPLTIVALCLWNLGRPPNLVGPRYASFFEKNATVDLAGWTWQRAASDGALRSPSSWTFSGPVGPIAAAPNQAVLVRLSSRVPRKRATVRVSWAGDGQSFDARRSAALEVLADGSHRDYRVVPSWSAGWSGTIGALRLEFVGVSDVSDIHVDELRIVR